MTFEVRATTQVTEAELIRKASERERFVRTWRGAVVVLGSLAIAIVLMIVSRYTFSLGLLIMLGLLFVLALPWIVSRIAHRQRRRWAHLVGEQEHGASTSEIWFRSAHLELRSSWANLYGWQLRDGSLHLCCVGMPVVMLPVELLIAAGCHAEVLALAQRSGTELTR